MNSSFFKTSSYSLKFIVFLIIIVSIFIIPIYYTYPHAFSTYSNKLILDDNSTYVWPIPGYTKITSPFGKRVSPTARFFKFS